MEVTVTQKFQDLIFAITTILKFYWKGDITVTSAIVTQLSFENVASFTKCIIKIDGTTTDQINVHINGI